MKTYSDLMEYANAHGSWDGGDQGLLNSFFSDWSTKDINRIIPFGYNVHGIASKWYVPAFERFKDEVKIIHFTGAQKPWLSESCPTVEWKDYWKKWWEFYMVECKEVSTLKTEIK